MPQIIACQAEKSDAIKRAFESDGVIRPVRGNTIADSISVKFPRDGAAAVKAFKESEGFAVSVNDDHIIQTITELAREASIFGEPVGVTPFAALQKAVNNNKVKEDERIIVLVTGNGLKDINAAMKLVKRPLKINPDIKELGRIVSKGLV